MPFTPSHAVVALPFLRTPLVPAAIAIGAMTPDLPLFVRGLGLNYSFTHTPMNVVWTGLLALLLFLAWRGILRPAVTELTPGWLARRLPAEWSLDSGESVRRALGAGQRRGYGVMLALSLLIGVLSHILWDQFTHEGRWGVQLLPVLDEQWGPLQGYKWLQHGSSLLGLLVLGVWVLLWLRRRPAAAVPVRRLPGRVRIGWWISLPVILLVAWVAGFAALGPFTPDFTVQHLAYRVLPPACAVWGVLTLGLCAIIGAARRTRR